MEEGRKTLIIILCMHRSGSSVLTSILHRLGMSLGPYELLGASQSNPYRPINGAAIGDLMNLFDFTKAPHA